MNFWVEGCHWVNLPNSVCFFILQFLLSNQKGGPPGVGKTQIGIQLSLCVQIPTQLGGANGQALYIDTEGSFRAERAAQMATRLAQRLVGSSVRE